MKNSTAVKLAIENVSKEATNDIFPRPFEVDLLKDERVRNAIRDDIIMRFNKIDTIAAGQTPRIDYGKLLEVLSLHSLQYVLFPKGEQFDFRKCALVHPIDEIKYLSLVIPFAKAFESKRPAPRKNRIFSYRYNPEDGYLFDPKYSITRFREHVRRKQKLKKVRVIVNCDISNFYDRLNLHRLESCLLSMPFPKIRVKLLNEVLLFWSNRDSYGLPVGSNASRILAEIALYEIDAQLMSQGVDFCRFVDDYRLFASSAKQAHYWLSLLIQRLSAEGLTLNHSKTTIREAKEA
jgi:hypothetical protein